jgi:hypothetical protein
MSDNQEQTIDARIAQVLRDNGHDDIAAALEAKSGSPTEEPAAERSEGEGVAQELRAVLDRGVTTIPDFLK